jgi:Neurotransmitter-gated ion-channel transmembrane region
MAMSVKTFVPIGLIVICAALVFFVRPHYVEGRIGLGITALLTLVALQLTSSATLPDVDYLMMLDKIYLLAYVFIIASLARVVLTSWRGADDAAEKSITRADRIWVSVLLAAYLAANAAVVLPALA